MQQLTIVLLISIFITACGGGGGGGVTTTGSRGGVTTTGSGVAAPTNTIPSGVGVISIRWDIPSLRADNSTLLALGDIGGFNVYLATNDNFIPSIPHATLTGSSVSDYTFNNLLPGTYHIYVTTYDKQLNESTFSTKLTKTII